MITPAQLKAIFPGCDAALWAPAIGDAWARYGFLGPFEQAGFLGICGNETGGFISTKRENMNYSLARAKEVFTKARNSPDICADRIARGAEPFANWIYAGVNGNGDEASGDGWRYRGNGITQLTGKGNHALCGAAIGVDLVAHPEALSNDPHASAFSAAWFMARARPEILPKLKAESEASFLEGAKLVGATDATATARRLDYRKRSLSALRQPGQAPALPSSAPALSPAAGSAPRPWWQGVLDMILRALGRKA